MCNGNWWYMQEGDDGVGGVSIRNLVRILSPSAWSIPPGVVQLGGWGSEWDETVGWFSERAGRCLSVTCGHTICVHVLSARWEAIGSGGLEDAVVSGASCVDWRMVSAGRSC